jgi:hypothetical protein
MARTHKWTYHESKAESHYFTHNGHADANPNKTKKNGAGKNNWGTPGDEINDLIQRGEIPPVMGKTRRGSNSSLLEDKLGQVQKYDEMIKEE